MRRSQVHHVVLANYIARGNGCTTRKDEFGPLRRVTSFVRDQYNFEFPHFLHRQELPGNTDRNTVFRQKLKPPIIAQFLRIYPLECNGRPALRLELYGCAAGK